MDVHAKWVGEPRKRFEGARTVLVRVLVLRKEPADWGLKRATLGVVMKGEDDRMDTAIVFAPGVFRVLGYEAGLPGACSEPEELQSVARAMARVALHEIIHVIAPGHEHVDEGLMSERLDRGKLLKRELSNDANCLLAFREGLKLRASRGG